MKKILAGMLFFALVVALIAPTSLKAHAETNTDLSKFDVVNGDEIVKDVKLNTDNLEQDVHKALDDYGLETINLNEDIPEGSQVISFDNMEDFHKFMSMTDQPIEEEVTTVEEYDEDSDLGENEVAPSYNLMATAAKSSSTTKTYKTSNNAGFGTINLYAKITRNSKGVVTAKSVWTSHTGVTLGIDWKQNYAYATLNSTKKGGKAYGGGTKSWVIFVSGIGTVKKQDVSLKLSF